MSDGFKMMEVGFEGYGGPVRRFINPNEVSMLRACFHQERRPWWTWLELLGDAGDPGGARTKIIMRDGNVVYSGKEVAEVVAEIESAVATAERGTR